MLEEMAKISPNKETGLGNGGHLKVLSNTNWSYMNMGDPLKSFRINLVSEPLEVPSLPKQFLGWGFLAVFYSKPALKVSKYQKQFMMSKLLPKNEQKSLPFTKEDGQDSEIRLLFGRNFNTINCF